MLDDPVPDDVARILGTLPEWFGLPDATVEYLKAARVMETWTVRLGIPAQQGLVVGILLVDRHFPHAAEVHLMAVERRYRGQGVGRALLAALEHDSRRRGVRLLEFKTLGPSHPDVGYARTRAFYEAAGFLPLEETELWGADNPCLFMVRPL
jgi:GNAT superfamily N-acetyltransferase